jgi:hypothetical protein
MVKVTCYATAIVAVALSGSVAAKADYAGGGPISRGSECFTYSKGQAREGRFGSWSACPQAASARSVRVSNTRARNSAPEEQVGAPTTSARQEGYHGN